MMLIFVLSSPKVYYHSKYITIPFSLLSQDIQKPIPWEFLQKPEYWAHFSLFSFPPEREAGSFISVTSHCACMGLWRTSAVDFSKHFDAALLGFVLTWCATTSYLVAEGLKI